MSSLPSRKIFKVLCPIERKDGKTHWLRVGSAFPNRDDSINLYLDVLPSNLKLQIRELDEDDLRSRDGDGAKKRTESRLDMSFPPAPAVKDELPF
jgi:hypothetical protein